MKKISEIARLVTGAIIGNDVISQEVETARGLTVAKYGFTSSLN
jgi:hypothetical protein